MMIIAVQAVWRRQRRALYHVAERQKIVASDLGPRFAAHPHKRRCVAAHEPFTRSYAAPLLGVALFPTTEVVG